MVSVLSPIEVRTAAADEVPTGGGGAGGRVHQRPRVHFPSAGPSAAEGAAANDVCGRDGAVRAGERGTVWTTSGYDGAVAELPPGAWEMPKSATGKEAFKWMWAFRTRLPRAIRVQRAMAERHLREPHFYVRTVGVRTALQGQGVGSALMQPTLEKADSAGLPAYIEASSERSAALYERLGFLHMGVFQLPEGGPPVWPMRRPPAGAHVGPND